MLTLSPTDSTTLRGAWLDAYLQDRFSNIVVDRLLDSRPVHVTGVGSIDTEAGIEMLEKDMEAKTDVRILEKAKNRA